MTSKLELYLNRVPIAQFRPTIDNSRLFLNYLRMTAGSARALSSVGTVKWSVEIALAILEYH